MPVGVFLSRRSSRGWPTRTILSSLAAVIVSACQASAPSTPRVERSDSAGVEVFHISGTIGAITTLSLSETVRTEVNGAEEPYLAEIGAVAWLTDGRVAIEDEQADEIHLFASDGQYLKRLGTQGDGPGEFQRISTLSLGIEDTLYAYDQRHGRISVLHPDAGFVRSVSFAIAPDNRSPNSVWRLPNGYLAFTQRPGTSAEGAFPQRVARQGSLTLHDENGVALHDPVSLPSGFSIVTEETEIYAAYTNQPVVAVGSDHLAYSSAERYSITVSDQQLNPRRSIRWSDREAPVPQSEVDSVRQVIRAWYSDIGASDVAETLANSVLAIVPDTRPPFARMLIDDRGRFWLESFEPDAPGWREPRSWHVLDEMANPVGQFQLPSNGSLLAVSGNSVLLSVLDSLDVPTIQVRDIVPD